MLFEVTDGSLSSDSSEDEALDITKIVDVAATAAKRRDNLINNDEQFSATDEQEDVEMTDADISNVVEEIQGRVGKEIELDFSSRPLWFPPKNFKPRPNPFTAQPLNDVPYRKSPAGITRRKTAEREAQAIGFNYIDSDPEENDEFHNVNDPNENARIFNRFFAAEKRRSSIVSVESLASHLVAIECPFPNCRFQYVDERPEDMRKHIEANHVRQKCPWCDKVLDHDPAGNLTREHVSAEHRQELLHSLGLQNSLGATIKDLPYLLVPLASGAEAVEPVDTKGVKIVPVNEVAKYISQPKEPAVEAAQDLPSPRSTPAAAAPEKEDDDSEEEYVEAPETAGPDVRQTEVEIEVEKVVEGEDDDDDDDDEDQPEPSDFVIEEGMMCSRCLRKVPKNSYKSKLGRQAEMLLHCNKRRNCRIPNQLGSAQDLPNRSGWVWIKDLPHGRTIPKIKAEFCYKYPSYQDSVFPIGKLNTAFKWDPNNDIRKGKGLWALPWPPQDRFRDQELSGYASSSNDDETENFKDYKSPKSYRWPKTPPRARSPMTPEEAKEAAAKTWPNYNHDPDEEFHIYDSEEDAPSDWVESGDEVADSSAIAPATKRKRAGVADPNYRPKKGDDVDDEIDEAELEDENPVPAKRAKTKTK